MHFENRILGNNLLLLKWNKKIPISTLFTDLKLLENLFKKVIK